MKVEELNYESESFANKSLTFALSGRPKWRLHCDMGNYVLAHYPTPNGYRMEGLQTTQNDTVRVLISLTVQDVDLRYFG